MSLNKKQRITKIKNLLIYRGEKEYLEDLFSHLVDMGYWNDKTIVNDQQKELFLYRDFFEYYDLLTLEGINGLDEGRQNLAIRAIKTQLDIELHRLKYNIKREEWKD